MGNFFTASPYFHYLESICPYLSPLRFVMSVSQLFDASNLFVLPFWGLMVFFPNWKVTRRVMQSYLPFVALAGLYLYLFVTSVTPESAEALANPTLSVIAEFFADERAAATGWVHFVVMDLFVGRWVYLEGQRTGVWTIHSIALCLFAGPLGLLSHILTSWITKAVKKEDEDGITDVEEAAQVLEGYVYCEGYCTSPLKPPQALGSNSLPQHLIQLPTLIPF